MAVTAADRLRSWPLAASLLAGLAVGLAVPPLWFLPGLLGFAVLAQILAPGCGRLRAFTTGTLFGFGYFIVGLYWVAIAFFVDAERFGLLAIPAVALLCLGLGMTIGVGTLIVAALRLRGVVPRALALAVVWSVTEIVRDHLLQFPWNPIAVVWAISDPTLQAIAWFGCTGLGLITVAVAASARPTASRGAAVVLLPLLLVATGEVRLHWLTPLADSHPVALRLVQADVPQTMKWDPQRARDWFERHLTLSQAPRATPAQVVIWPESAVPYEIEREPLVRDLIARVLPPGAVAIVGGDRFEGVGPTAVGHNSVFAIDDRGRIVEHYDKVDLVPFGEFLPFRRYLGAVGLDKLAPGQSDFTPGSGRVTMTLPGLPSASPLVCYEAIFPDRAALTRPRPAWLVNITNDGWFGDSSGPYQHLAMARMRAVEEGLPLVRAANTGISVVTDAFGRVTARLPLGARGVLDSTLPPPLAREAWSRRIGWVLPAGLLVAAGLIAVMVELIHRRRA